MQLAIWNIHKFSCETLCTQEELRLHSFDEKEDMQNLDKYLQSKIIMASEPNMSKCMANPDCKMKINMFSSSIKLTITCLCCTVYVVYICCILKTLVNSCFGQHHCSTNVLDVPICWHSIGHGLINTDTCITCQHMW